MKKEINDFLNGIHAMATAAGKTIRAPWAWHDTALIGQANHDRAGIVVRTRCPVSYTAPISRESSLPTAEAIRYAPSTRTL